MYIEPNSTVHLIANIPLDNKYDHTLFFNDELEQQNFFLNEVKLSFTALTYQRVTKNKLRVQSPISGLRAFNYMAFKNTSFENKWFYAFVTSIEYVNNVTTEITYEIDVMQSWFFDYTLSPCFVEREHSATDEIGDNLVDENIGTGEYISARAYNYPTDSMRYLYIVQQAFSDETIAERFAVNYGGLYSGLGYIGFTEDQLHLLAEYIVTVASSGTPDSIVSIFVIPEVPNQNIVSDTPFTTDYYNYRYEGLKRKDGTRPKNNKLFVYPYNFVYVTNNNGSSATFKYEYFNDPISESGFTLRFQSTVVPGGEMMCYPLNYKGIAENVDENIALAGFPLIPYATDSYRAWLAQNTGSMVASTVMSVAALGASVAMGNVPGIVGGGLGLAGTITNNIASIQKASMMPPQAHAGSGSILTAARKLKFEVYRKFIAPDYVSIIDDYFTLYGYATKRVKVPNRNVRPHWTFTKTVGCHIDAHFPYDDVQRICNIYDNGITFWRNADELGNYNLDNSPYVG